MSCEEFEPMDLGSCKVVALVVVRTLPERDARNYDIVVVVGVVSSS